MANEGEIPSVKDLASSGNYAQLFLFTSVVLREITVLARKYPLGP